MNGRLIYHPDLITTSCDGITVHHDSFIGNQDPYVWNRQFLHTYCHMGQIREGFNKRNNHPVVEEGDFNFWVTAEKHRGFSALYCDLVFFVANKVYWNEPNSIKRGDSIVDSDEAYEDHYKWWCDHPFKEKQLEKGLNRFTLKADPILSFQPQNNNGELLNILEFLRKLHIDEDAMRSTIGDSCFAFPFYIEDVMALSLYDFLKQEAYYKRLGEEFQVIRQKCPKLNRYRV